jgi:Tfp pilus assembly protein PilX
VKRRHPPNPVPRRARGGRRRGVILIVVLVCLAVAGAIAMSLLRTAAAARRAAETRLRHAQAQWLAESGLERAAARLAVDPRYAGEVWSTAAGELDGGTGVVRIEVDAAAARPDCRIVRVRADFPDDPHDRARQTKEVLIRLRTLSANMENEP